MIAAFNGIEQMVERLYSEFDAPIIIYPKKGKTIDLSTFPLEKIKKVNNVEFLSKAIEEIVIVKHEKKWVNAKIYGVDDNFYKMANIKQHIVDGERVKSPKKSIGLIGAGLLDKLQGYIHSDSSFESLILYIPKRNAKLHSMSSPFKTDNILVSGRINYNKEVNDEAILLPFNYVQQLLDLENYSNSIFLSIKEKKYLNNTKEEIQQILGNKFYVTTYLEKNKLIFQTSKSEKLIVFYILLFVFILALFNLISSLTMLFIEKKQNMKWLNVMGLSYVNIKKVFFFQGIFISLKGIIFGFVLGFGLVFAQKMGSFIVLPNSNYQAFPVLLKTVDIAIIFGFVIIFSILASFLTVNFLSKSFNNKMNEK
ncbi:MAG: ABC transporter permease [Flavobacteriia bacterium]|nr:ABC transporter permease [Flavobacteriia bacterium]